MIAPLETTGRRLATNLPKYYVYIVFKNFAFGLFIAFWVIYLQRYRGLNLTQATLSDVAFWIAVTLGEVPTGVVADRYGRKISITIGSAMALVGMIAWTIAPTILLIMAANVVFGIGLTFLSGAEDALLFETTSNLGRVAEYTQIVGRVGAFALAGLAIGSLASGLLGTLDLRLPPVVACISFVVVFVIALTFSEPHREATAKHEREGYGTILRHALTILREKPALRYAIFYMTLIPVTSLILEFVLLQPQILAMGLPVAAVGAVIMSIQFVKMAGSSWAHRFKSSFGEARIILLAPYLMAFCLVRSGIFQILPALLFAAVVSFVVAVINPLVITRIQSLVTDNIRATVLSLQSLLTATVLAIVEPSVGLLVDHRGLPAAYYAMAAALIILSMLLFWKSRPQFP